MDCWCQEERQVTSNDSLTQPPRSPVRKPDTGHMWSRLRSAVLSGTALCPSVLNGDRFESRVSSPRILWKPAVPHLLLLNSPPSASWRGGGGILLQPQASFLQGSWAERGLKIKGRRLYSNPSLPSIVPVKGRKRKVPELHWGAL